MNANSKTKRTMNTSTNESMEIIRNMSRNSNTSINMSVNDNCFKKINKFQNKPKFSTFTRSTILAIIS